MSRFRALQVAALLLTCSAALFAADNRAVETWRLRSQQIVEGSSATPRFAAKTIMTVRQGSSGNFVVQIEPKQPRVADEIVMVQEDFSPNGKRMTQTMTSTKPSQYRMIRIWDKR
jgi:hypothetical protein